MDLSDRIARRRHSRRRGDVFVDREVVSPIAHRSEPVGRGPILEQLLDALDPVFDGGIPPDVTVVGPPGSGKSAVVSALFVALDDALGEADRAIGTTTRAESRDLVTRFVVVDARRTRSEFAFYRDVLAAVSSDAIPESGVGTDALRDRLVTHLDRTDRSAVVAIDHHDEPESLTYDRVRTLLVPVEERVSVVAVGETVRTEDSVGNHESHDPDGPVVEIPPYRRHELVDVLTSRASEGLAPGALDHDSTRELAAWADGNAHDALAALFGAAVLATEAGDDRIDDEYLQVAMADVPDDGVHVARALSLPPNRQRVLHALVSLAFADRPLRAVADEIAADSTLTVSTVTRFLYELADYGVVDRVQLPANGSGRRPSSVVPRFPTIAFRALSVVDSNDC